MIPAAGGHLHPPRVSGRFMLVYAFAQYAAWLALLTPIIITIALKVGQIATIAQKGTYLATVLAIGAIGALIAAPVWGAISDRTTARIGRRKPWMVVGALLLLVGLTVMAFAASLWMLGVGWMICQIGSNANQAALNAVIHDVVPEEQRGRMAGLLGLTLPLAFVSGTFVTQFSSGDAVAMFLIPWLPSAAAVTLMMIYMPDRPAGPMPALAWRDVGRTFWVNPVRHPDFGWAFASRFLLTLAVAFSQTYQVYFLTDHIHVEIAGVARAMFLCTLVTAILTTILTPAGGWLSDRTRRVKPFVIAAALVVAAGLVAVALSLSFAQFLIAVAIVGVGQGVYYAVDIALCVAVLPDPDTAAKDMGVIQIANSLPQSIAPAIAPLFLSIGVGANASAGAAQNYPAVFIAAAVFALAGGLAILPIRRVR